MKKPYQTVTRHRFRLLPIEEFRWTDEYDENPDTIIVHAIELTNTGSVWFEGYRVKKDGTVSEQQRTLSVELRQIPSDLMVDMLEYLLTGRKD